MQNHSATMKHECPSIDTRGGISTGFSGLWLYLGAAWMTLLPYSADIVNCSKVDSRTPIIFVFFCSNSHQLCLGYAMNGERNHGWLVVHRITSSN